MIARSYRFLGRNSLKFVLTRGQTLKGSDFKVRYVYNTRTPGFRLAIVVSRKVDKKAVVRNRIRRRLYELFRQTFLDQKLHFDIVVFVFNNRLAFISATELQKIIQPICQHFLKMQTQSFKSKHN